MNETLEIDLEPKLSLILKRGFSRKCPKCGEGKSFAGYLKVIPSCEHCGEDLGHIRADDFPPYLTIFIVGHIIIPLLVIVERAYHPPLWLQTSFWSLSAFLLTLWLLPRIKGMVLNYMWRVKLTGTEFQ